MPTLLRLAGLRVTIYPNDHRPAHIHELGPGAEAVFVLNCPDGPPELRESCGFNLSEARRIGAMLGGGLARLCEEWTRIHGRY